MSTRHQFTASRSSSSYKVLQVADMSQARIADLCHAGTQETRMLKKPFFDPAVCEKNFYET